MKFTCLILLTLLCGAFQMSHGVKLKCDFLYQHTSNGEIYICFVKSLNITQNNKVITRIRNPNDQQPYDAVTKMVIENSNVNYIPKNLGSFFDLTELIMTNTQLVAIKLRNFIGMEELEVLDLSKNNLTLIPLDAFSTLTKLKSINLNWNQIVEIPNGVFKNNLHLEKIELSDNKIKFLGSTLFHGLSKLNRVDLEDNICIDESYSGSTEIIQLKDDIKKKCKNPNVIPTMNPIEILFVEINDQIARTKEELISEFVDDTEEHKQKLIKLLTKTSRMNCLFTYTAYYWKTYYSCIVTSLNNDVTDITGYYGNHYKYNTDSDVEGIRIQGTNAKFIPGDLGLLFNLTTFEMRFSQLVEIKSKDFDGMQDLEELGLAKNKLTSVPVDAFSSLTKLIIIDLAENQIEEIPNDVFANNIKLELIHLRENKIKFMNPTLFDGLTRLNSVSLRSNVCINEHYEGITKIIQLKNDIQLNCNTPNIPQPPQDYENYD